MYLSMAHIKQNIIVIKYPLAGYINTIITILSADICTQNIHYNHFSQVS